MKIQLNVIEKTEIKVLLENSNGNLFEFNPTTRNGEELYDFLFFKK